MNTQQELHGLHNIKISISLPCVSSGDGNRSFCRNVVLLFMCFNTSRRGKSIEFKQFWMWICVSVVLLITVIIFLNSIIKRGVYCAVRTEFLYIYVDGTPWRSAFIPGVVLVRFVVDKVALGQIFLSVFLFSPVSIISPLLHAYLYIYAVLITRTNWRSRVLHTKGERRGSTLLKEFGWIHCCVSGF